MKIAAIAAFLCLLGAGVVWIYLSGSSAEREQLAIMKAQKAEADTQAEKTVR